MLIVALDVYTLDEAKAIVGATTSQVAIYKIGLQLLTAEGPEIIRYLKSIGKTVFLDLKLHEISNSVASAVTAAGRHDVDMISVHASGGQQMMAAAVEAAASFDGMKVLALTVVTGLNDSDLSAMGVQRNSEEQVITLAVLAQRSGCHGVIASVQEVAHLRRVLADEILILTPAIRPARSECHDQRRAGTPEQAIRDGASHIVVGRPVVYADRPQLVVQEINQQIASAHASRGS